MVGEAIAIEVGEGGIEDQRVRTERSQRISEISVPPPDDEQVIDMEWALCVCVQRFIEKCNALAVELQDV